MPDLLNSVTMETFDSAASKKAWLKRKRNADERIAAAEESRAQTAADIAKTPRPPERHGAEDIAAHAAEDEPMWAARAAVLSRLDSMGPGSTAVAHKNQNGDYTAARKKKQQAVVDAWFAHHKNVPNDGEAVVLGGLPGSGKGGALGNPQVGIEKGRYATVDPDEVKQQMLDAGFMERIPGLSDGEHAALLHEESGHIADMITARAISERKNIVLDKTMSKSQRGAIQGMRDAGYSRVTGVYVDVRPSESQQSATTRWKQGGRFIPPSYIGESDLGGGKVKNRNAFIGDTALFDEWVHVDNTGIAQRKPRGSVTTGTGQVDSLPPLGKAKKASMSLWLTDFDGSRYVQFATVDADPERWDDLVATIDAAVDAGDLTADTFTAAGFTATFADLVDDPTGLDHLTLDDHEAWQFAMPSQLHNYWVNGKGASEVRWGTKGSFTRCVALLRSKVESPEAMCAQLHHDATGKWPGQKAAAALDHLEVFGYEQVPRDGHGKWAGHTAATAWPAHDAGGPTPGAAPQLAGNVIAGRKVNVAADTLPAVLGELGNSPIDSDLTLVNTVGHPNLYRDVARNTISRDDMPQIPTAHLDEFRGHLNSRGIGTRLVDVDPASLRATQNELNGRKVGSMLTKMQTTQMVGDDHPLWISADGKILDGHHRWAAQAAMSAAGPQQTIRAVRVEAPMSQLLPIAREFSATLPALVASTMEEFDSEASRKAWDKRGRGDGGGAKHVLSDAAWQVWQEEHAKTEPTAAMPTSVTQSPGREIRQYGSAAQAAGSYAVATKAFTQTSDRGEAEAAVERLRSQLSPDQADAYDAYRTADYKNINAAVTGRPGKFEERSAARAAQLDQVMRDHATPVDHDVLMRGTHVSGSQSLNAGVGDEFTDPKFGSWTSHGDVARQFAHTNGTDPYESEDHHGTFMVLRNARSTRGIPGNGFEHETILPRGQRYRVTSITDFVDPNTDPDGPTVNPPGTTVDYNGKQLDVSGRPKGFRFRIMEVEAVDSPNLVAAAGMETFDSAASKKAWEKRRAAKAAAAAPSSPPSGPPHLNGLPGPEQFATMQTKAGPLGSQGGKWYIDGNGQRYLVKPAQSRSHAMNELSASLLYQHAGVASDQTGIYEDGGKWYIAKKAIQNSDGSLGKQVGMHPSAKIQAQAREGFGADALASSWDAFGLNGDNVITDDAGGLHRIDVGGSLAYRAMGGDKPSFNPGEKWTEPSSLRTSNQGRSLYGNMTDAQAHAQLSKLSSFDVVAYDAKLGAAGVDQANRTRIVSTVRDRIENQLPGILASLSS